MLLRFFLCLFGFLISTQSYGFTVVIDPGHGGEDSGTVQNIGSQDFVEKDFTLSFSQRLSRNLRELGIRNFLTRNSDKTLSLDDRVAIANRLAETENTVFISVHANSSYEPAASGMETYVFNATTNQASKRLAKLENGNQKVEVDEHSDDLHGTLNLILADLSTSANFTESVELACTVHQAMATTQIPFKNRGVKQALFYVLMQSRVPSILIEPGFASNPKDVKKLLNPSIQEWLTLKVSKALAHYAARLQPNLLSGIAKKKRKPYRICKVQQ